MFDHDVVIIGGGPSGLTAGTILARADVRVLLLEKEDFGGYLKKVERFNGHPDYPEGVCGPELAEKLLEQATHSGLQMEFGEVEAVESYSGCKSVTCTDGKNFTASAIIIAGGRRPRKLNIPGETEFLNRGVIHCVLCDAALYRDKDVAVCGGGNTGISDAMQLARYAKRVFVIEQTSALTAMEKLAAVAQAERRLEFILESTINNITGKQAVEGIDIRNLKTGATSLMKVDGVVIDVGYTPDTHYLDGIIPLDDAGRVIVINDGLQTEINGVFASGDIRSNTQLNLIGAILDGKKTAAAIMNLLEIKQ